MKTHARGVTQTALAEAMDRSFRIALFVCLVLALLWLVSGLRSIGSDQQAVILSGGEVRTVHYEAGLVLALPEPLERVLVLPGASQGLALEADTLALPEGHFSDAYAGTVSAEGSIIGLQAQARYRIHDPIAYELASTDVEAALRRYLANACLHHAAGSDLDTMLIHERAAMRERIAAFVNARIEAQSVPLGVRVDRVELTTTLPAKAKQQFDRAQSALAEADTRIAQARADAERTRRQAVSESRRLRDEAAATAAELRDEAARVVARVRAWRSEPGAADGERARWRAYQAQMRDAFAAARRVVLLPADDALRLRSNVHQMVAP